MSPPRASAHMKHTCSSKGLRPPRPTHPPAPRPTYRPRPRSCPRPDPGPKLQCGMAAMMMMQMVVATEFDRYGRKCTIPQASMRSLRLAVACGRRRLRARRRLSAISAVCGGLNKGHLRCEDGQTHAAQRCRTCARSNFAPRCWIQLSPSSPSPFAPSHPFPRLRRPLLAGGPPWWRFPLDRNPYSSSRSTSLSPPKCYTRPPRVTCDTPALG